MKAIVLVLKGVAMTEEENGHYLHAARISMSHPLTGLPLVVEAPLPAEFDGIV